MLGENYTLIYLWIKGIIRVSPHKSVEKSRNCLNTYLVFVGIHLWYSSKVKKNIVKNTYNITLYFYRFVGSFRDQVRGTQQSRCGPSGPQSDRAEHTLSPSVSPTP